MSIVWTREVRWSGAGSEQVTRGSTGSVTYSRQFFVLTDDIDDNWPTVREASGLPQINDSYSHGSDTDGSAVCTAKRGRREANAPKLWHVECEYTLIPGSQGGGGTIDVTAYLPEIRIYPMHYRRPATEDSGGDPILNSANELYDPPPEKDDNRHVIEIVRNELTFSLGTAEEYENHTNDAALFGLAAGRIKMHSIGGTRMSLHNQIYWQVRYEMHVSDFNNDGGWAIELADMGYNRLATAQEKSDGDANANGLMRCTDASGDPVTRPAYLDGSGAQLDPESDDIVYNSYTIYPENDFSTFNFPDLNLAE